MSLKQQDSFPPAGSSFTIKFVLDQVVKSLEDIKTITHNLQIQQQSCNIDISNVKLDISNLHEKTSDIDKIIKEGNGKESILTRLALIEKSLEELKDKLSKTDAEKKEITHGKWQVIVALITGSISLITTLATIIFKLLG